MSWLFSRALVEASLLDNCWAGDASAPSNTTPTPQAGNPGSRPAGKGGKVLIWREAF